MFCSKAHDDSRSDTHFSIGKVQYLKIYVADEPQLRGGVLRFKAKVFFGYTGSKRIGLSGMLMTAIKSDSSVSSDRNTIDPKCISYGKTFLIPARYATIEGPYNPGEFDFKNWSAHHHIYHQTLLSPEELSPTPEERGNPIVAYALRLRKRQVERYRKLIKNTEAFAVASTLILGYRSDLDAETLAAYSSTGTIHALSVSGMHVGIIYVVLDWALRWMNRKSALKAGKAFLIISLIWAYTILTGYSASVLRSAITLSLFVLAKNNNSNTLSYHTLYCSAFILLLYDPFLLWDLGFQLSYLSVLGLFWLQPKIEGLIVFRKNWARQIWSLISLSISAQVFTFPLSIYYFHQFPVYFILSNLFIALPVAILMYLGIAILILPFDCLSVPFEWIIIFMNRGLLWISELPHATILSIWINRTELLLLCLFLLFLLTGFSRKRKNLIFASAISLFLLVGSMSYAKLSQINRKTILLFSLTKGYAAAFISAQTAVVITDFSAQDLAFKFHVQPALDQLHIYDIRCLPWGREINISGLQIKDHQLHFRGYKILLLDTTIKRKKILGRPVFDAVWLHNSPGVNLRELSEQTIFKKIWIDASNKNYVFHEFSADSINFRKLAVPLKKNKAYLVQLK